MNYIDLLSEVGVVIDDQKEFIDVLAGKQTETDKLDEALQTGDLETFRNLLYGIPIDTGDNTLVDDDCASVDPGYGYRQVSVYSYNELRPGMWEYEDMLRGRAVFAHSFDDEKKLKRKKHHFYSRQDRFRFIVYDLMGVGRTVPIEVVDLIKRNLKYYKQTREKIWNTIRKILKANDYGGMYYNQIPEIIQRIKGWRPVGVGPANLPELLNDFRIMSHEFDKGKDGRKPGNLAQKWKRTYFLNLRFVGLKLLKMYGVTYPYFTPLVKLSTKRNELELLFSDLIEAVAPIGIIQ